jgi:hypothetical protein
MFYFTKIKENEMTDQEKYCLMTNFRFYMNWIPIILTKFVFNKSVNLIDKDYSRLFRDLERRLDLIIYTLVLAF